MKNKFNFDEKSVHHYMKRELKVFHQNSEAFRYIADKLPNQTELDLNKVNWLEGKNYHWCVIVDNDVTLIIRQYHSHFVIYTKFVSVNEYSKTENYIKNIYGSLMFESHSENDDNFFDLNNSLKQLIDIVRKEELHTLWNDLCFVRPKTVKVHLIFQGEEISSVDKMMFALDEISQLYLELFSENDMLQKISTLKKGDNLGVNNVVESVTFQIINPDDIYYHGLGIHYIDNWEKKQWLDVYGLTRWFFEDLFPEGIKNGSDLIWKIVKK